MKKMFFYFFQIIIIMLVSSKTVYATINFNYKELNIGINVSQQLILSGDISGNVTWENSNDKIASLNNGYVTGLSLGTTYITAVNGEYSSSCKVNVIANYIAVKEITLPDSSIELLVNSTENINAKVNPSNASNSTLLYSSNDPSVVTVDQNGNITGNKIGTAYITIVAETKSASLKVNVVDKISLKSIEIVPQTLTLTEGNSGKLEVAFNPNNATDKSVTWQSSNSNIVTVDSSGNLKAISSGTATITATSNDGGYTSSSKIIVKALDKSLKGISLNKAELNIVVGESDNLSVNYNPSYASNKEVTWESSNTEVATVENGKVVAKTPGNAEIKVTSKEGNYQATCKVNVLSPPIESIKFEYEEYMASVGTTITLKTISTPENTIINDPIWTSSDETVATIVDGELTALQVGKTTITVSDPEGKISATTEVNVIEEALMITISGYDLNFDPKIKTYTLKIGNEKALNIDVNRDKNKVTIGGNNDLQNGSIITITINEKTKTTYVINIIKKKSNYIYFIVAVTILLIINIIRILLKKKKNK